LPKLSERREDIPQLAHHFLQKSAQELAVEPKLLLPKTEQFLCQLEWPGNVRQLENLCHWLTVMAAGREIHISDLPPELRDQQLSPEIVDNWEAALRSWAESTLKSNPENILSQSLPAFERVLIEAALDHTAGHKHDAALILGWGRNTLTRKIKALKLEKP
jgi:two-component system nitrogen regulation response regulator GlnG